MENLWKVDREIASAIYGELVREDEEIILIASENYVSEAVLEALGSVLTNKYAEGYPAKRFYQGCEWVDRTEEICRERARAVFRCQYANVQPHSGTQANMAVYFSILQPGDTILSMDLAHGGHLSHGHKANFSGKLFRMVFYGVDPKTETIDYDAVAAKARECSPKLIVAGASAYPRKIDFARFRAIADEVGAKVMVDIAHIAGLVAGGDHPPPRPVAPGVPQTTHNTHPGPRGGGALGGGPPPPRGGGGPPPPPPDPVPFADFVTVTNHKTIRGPRGGMILCREEYGKAIDRNVFPGIQGGPLMHVIAAKAVSLREAQSPGFKKYQHQIILNTAALAEEMKRRGYRLVSGGTDNHLFLVDLRGRGINGKQAAAALTRAGICCNSNLIPFDPLPATATSGIRLGTPAVTTRGMKEKEMERIGGWIAEVIAHPEDEKTIGRVRHGVKELTAAYPVYPRLKELWKPRPEVAY